MKVQLTYDRLSTGDLNGTLVADYLVALDAELTVSVQGRTVMVESGFPVVELARDLAAWLEEPHRGDFVFDSMSYEDPGSLILWETASGWTVDSSLTSWNPSAIVTQEDVEAGCRRLLTRVHDDLVALGVRPFELLGPSIA